MAMRPLGNLALNSPRVSSAKRPVARVLDYSDIDVNAPPSLDKFAEVDAPPPMATHHLATASNLLATHAEQGSWRPGIVAEAEAESDARVEGVKREGQLELERMVLAHEREAAQTRRAMSRLTQRNAQLAEGNKVLCSLLKRVHTECKLAIPFLTVEDELCNASSHEAEESAYWEDMRHIRTFYEAQARGLTEHLDERLRESASAIAELTSKLEVLERLNASAASAPSAGVEEAAIVAPPQTSAAAAPVRAPVGPASVADSAPIVSAAAHEPPALPALGARSVDPAETVTGSAPSADKGAPESGPARPAPIPEESASQQPAAAHPAARSTVAFAPTASSEALPAAVRAAGPALESAPPPSSVASAAAAADRTIGFDVQELQRMKQRFEEIMKKHEHVKEQATTSAAPLPPAVPMQPPYAAAAAEREAQPAPPQPVASRSAKLAVPPVPNGPAAPRGEPAPAAPAASAASKAAAEKSCNLDVQCDRNATWLQPSLLEAALVRQQTFDPDEVFFPLTRQLTCDLAEVFGKPDLQKRHRRGGSGEWALSPALVRGAQSSQQQQQQQQLAPVPLPPAVPAPVAAASSLTAPTAVAGAAGTGVTTGTTARLLAVEGPYHAVAPLALFRLPAPGVALLIGRSSACDVVLNLDDQISRRHMRIECRGGKFLAFDDGSTYGTTINEWQLGSKESAVLRDGDLVMIGASRFRFQIIS